MEFLKYLITILDNLEELNILSMHEDYDSIIITIQNSRLIVKISECDIFKEEI